MDEGKPAEPFEFKYADQILLNDDFPEVEPLAKDKKDPDEKFFIRTHRAFEIWFADILDEIEYARLLLAELPRVPEDAVPQIAHHLHRAAVIFDLLRNHLPVLETLQTSSFYDFRSALFGASGGDSYRFRAIEWALGFLEPDLFEYATERQAPLHADAGRRFADDTMLKSLESYRDRYKGFTLPDDIQKKVGHLREDARKNVATQFERAKKSETLRSALFAWLQRTPFLGETGADLSSDHYEYFKGKYIPEYVNAYVADVNRSVELKLGDQAGIDSARKDAEARAEWFMGDRRRAAIVFILQFARQPLLAWPAMLLEAFIDLDEAFSNWRERHVQMVAHVLGGGRVSTMGSQSSGLPYLRPTTGKKAFPEIWDARSFFLSRNEAAAVYPTMAKGDPYFAPQLRLLRLAYEDDEQTKERQKKQQQKKDQ